MGTVDWLGGGICDSGANALEIQRGDQPQQNSGLDGAVQSGL